MPYPRHATEREQRALRAALADCERAIKLNPQSAVVFYRRGTIHHALGDYAAALADYARAIELDPHYGDAVYNSACAFALQEQPSAACEWLRRAIAMDKKYLELCRTDSDFDPIRQTPEFQAVLSDMF